MKDNELLTHAGSADLASQIRKGEERAFQQVHSIYKVRLLIYVNRLVGNWDEAEDLVAEAFVALWQWRHTIQSEEHIGKFLFLTVRNKAFNFTDKRKRREKLIQELPVANDTDEDLRDLLLVEEQMLHLLHQAVTSLPTECARVFELTWHGEKSPTEIGHMLGMNPATVRSQKRRAIKLIREWVRKRTSFILIVPGLFFTLYTFFQKNPFFFCTMGSLIGYCI